MPEPSPEVRVAVRRLELGGRVLFENLSLRVAGAQTTALLGASGVGKSTLLRLVAGLLPGALVTTPSGPGLARAIALMAQNDALLPWLTAIDNVLLGPRLRGTRGAELARARDRARELLRDVGLEGRTDALPGTLSGGMRQRVALARTLLEDRPIVLMDEPFSALDAITRHRLQDLAAGLLAGRTVLLVTHSPAEALRVAHRVLVLTGEPARPGAAIVPPGAPPRDGRDPELLGLQARLLEELADGTPARRVA